MDKISDTNKDTKQKTNDTTRKDYKTEKQTEPTSNCYWYAFLS